MCLQLKLQESLMILISSMSALVSTSVGRHLDKAAFSLGSKSEAQDAEELPHDFAASGDPTR